jgi:peroxiredoxin
MNLKIGQKFPDIELSDQENQPAKLSELVGKFPFVLAFYRGYW